LEVSVHGQLAVLLVDLCWVLFAEEAAHLMVAGKQRESKREKSLNSPFKGFL
jgi:hypothetical protein